MASPADWGWPQSLDADPSSPNFSDVLSPVFLAKSPASPSTGGAGMAMSSFLGMASAAKEPPASPALGSGSLAGDGLATKSSPFRCLQPSTPSPTGQRHARGARQRQRLETSGMGQEEQLPTTAAAASTPSAAPRHECATTTPERRMWSVDDFELGGQLGSGA